MPRKPIIRSNQHYYHIVARSNNQEYFYLPSQEIWQMMTGKLGELQKKFDLEIGAFVLMNNHFHLLILSPEVDIDRVMYFFMKEITLSIQRRTKRINKIFGGRYKGCIIEHQNYLMNVFKYIYRNPVAAGITEKVENYSYSTLFYQLNSMTQPFELSRLFNLEVGLMLAWLNASFKEQEAQSIKNGLKKTVFDYKKDRATGRVIGPNFYNELLT